MAIERAEIAHKNVPRPLVVVECKTFSFDLISVLYYIMIHFKGMLLLLKETYIHGRYFIDFNYLKNVEGLLAYKKSCGNTIKFATQNIPPAVIQVKQKTKDLYFMRNLISSSITTVGHHSSLRFRNDYSNGKNFFQGRHSGRTSSRDPTFLHTNHAGNAGN